MTARTKECLGDSGSPWTSAPTQRLEANETVKPLSFRDCDTPGVRPSAAERERRTSDRPPTNRFSTWRS